MHTMHAHHTYAITLMTSILTVQPIYTRNLSIQNEWVVITRNDIKTDSLLWKAGLHSVVGGATLVS